jgi:hypothetical protein
VGPVRASRRRFAAAFSPALVAALSVLALSPAAPASAATCPSFRVLHNDRIGPAQLPAGNYEIAVDPGLNCQSASRLFARFLQDWDGNLPRPWQVSSRGSGRAAFTRGNQPGFTATRIAGGGGGNRELGSLCRVPYTVNAASRVGPLAFARGRYLIYIPTGSRITCRRASVIFTRFLAAPGGTLPFPWRVRTQTATFFKPAHPRRSAFRLESIHGV